MLDYVIHILPAPKCCSSSFQALGIVKEFQFHALERSLLEVNIR